MPRSTQTEAAFASNGSTSLNLFLFVCELLRPIDQVKAAAIRSGTIWWGEATDEPARADARPTENATVPLPCNWLAILVEMCSLQLENAEATETPSDRTFTHASDQGLWSAVARHGRSLRRCADQLYHSEEFRHAP